MSLDLEKVAKITRRIREYQSTLTPVPRGDEVKGMPRAGSPNTDETHAEDPMAHNTPYDIGPTNSQTVSGTGYGASPGRIPGSID